MLTPAEWAVLALLKDGASNPGIAAARGVSANTVRAQVSSILAKLDLPDRRAANETEVFMATRESATVVLRCSFCGRTDNRVELLLVGPAGVHICGECVDACNRIIERTHRAS